MSEASKWVLAVGLVAIAALAGCGSPEVPAPSAPAGVTRTPFDPDAVRADAVQGRGSRAEPLNLGKTIAADRVNLVVDAYEANADDVVEAAANDAPPPGYHYSVVTYSVTNTYGEELYVDLISVVLVTSDDELIDEPVATLDDEMSGTVAAGATITGSRAFLVPAGSDVLIAVSPGVPTDSAYYVAP